MGFRKRRHVALSSPVTFVTGAELFCLVTTVWLFRVAKRLDAYEQHKREIFEREVLRRFQDATKPPQD